MKLLSMMVLNIVAADKIFMQQRHQVSEHTQKVNMKVINMTANVVPTRQQQLEMLFMMVSNIAAADVTIKQQHREI